LPPAFRKLRRPAHRQTVSSSLGCVRSVLTPVLTDDCPPEAPSKQTMVAKRVDRALALQG